MQPGEVREHFIDRLSAFYGAPKNAEVLATEVAKHVPERATAKDLENLADRLIATRNAKGFPGARDLIDTARSIAPTGAAVASGGTGIPGEIVFDGEMPMVWILGDDPRWAALCAIAKAMEPRAKNGKPPHPMATTSKYAPGVGRFFRVEHARGVPVTDEERQRITGLYADAQRPPDRHRAQQVVARIAEGMDMLRASLAPAGTMPKISDREVAADSLRKRLVENGQDPAGLDTIRDAPRRRTGA